MSSTEGQLCVNFTVPSSFTPCRKKKAPHSRQWKKLKADKRKISSDRSPSKKRRGEQKPPLISPSEGPPPSKQRREEEKPPQTPPSSETPPSKQEKPPQKTSSSETPLSKQEKPLQKTSSSETPPSKQEKPPQKSSSSEAPPSKQEKPPQKTSSERPPSKQKRREEDKPQDKATEQQASTPPSQKKQKRMKEGHQANGEKRERHGVKGGVKTSSLFKHNPDIPNIDRPNVSQLKEKVFSTDSFADTDLHPHLVATLNKVLNISTMTSVQKQTIPVLLSGRDAVVRSQTGSGKTLAYGIPIVQSLQAVEPKIQRADGPLALIIVPTRELALQSFQTFQKLVKPFTWIVPGVLMGGEKRKAEKARLRKGINILVCTPGRLVDHIKHTLNISFTSIRWLVLDEADRTLDLGFEKDLTVIMNAVNSAADDRTNVLLSATMTQDLSRLADVCMNNPVRINASDPASSDDITTAVTPDPGSAGQSESFSVPEALQQNVVMVPSKLRLVCLAAFILDKCKGNKLIVFISSCEAVEFLLSLFTSVLCGPAANQKRPVNFLRLHGNMKQEERTEAFEEFSVCKTGVLLCTDVAARGLDLPQVTWIIQYNPPTSVTEYVHRVGRTARIGTRGSCLLFLTPAEAGFITDLANHKISLSEIKLLDILSNLMLDDTYKGRGKYHSQTSSKALEQEIRERATVLQTEFENVVHSNPQNVQNAKKALQSFLRSYAAYPSSLKHIFHIRGLHLGHAAKSFGLRDAPQGLSAAGQKDTSRKQTKNQDKGKAQRSVKQRVSSLMHSEFSSGMTDSKKKRRNKKKTGGQVEPEDEEVE